MAITCSLGNSADLNSDTVASTLINLFYRLAIHPNHTTKIREEVSTVDWMSDSQRLRDLDHMNGTINEVLRLHPSVPTGGYRETPPEGLKIAGTWIPGNTTIVAPRYTMGRRKLLRIRQPQYVNPEEDPADY